MRTVNLVRGRVYAARFQHVEDEKYYLVVSNNRRNRQLQQALAVRLTTSPKPSLRSVVELDANEAFCGRVL
ncbi:MAG: type II toxin-antitoxin system PemK/MazF family toxin, partial [Candidatus Saccharimonadales bacterium]